MLLCGLCAERCSITQAPTSPSQPPRRPQRQLQKQPAPPRLRDDKVEEAPAATAQPAELPRAEFDRADFVEAEIASGALRIC